MKTKLTILLACCVVAASAQTNLVDISTPHTNAVAGGGGAATLTLTNIATLTNFSGQIVSLSANYATTNPTSVYYGDALYTAFGKQNVNTLDLNAWQGGIVTAIDGVSNSFMPTVTGFATFMATNNIFGVLAGITADGTGDITNSGTITASGFIGSLWDNGFSSGTATYVPTANGDGSWTWAAPSGGGGGGTMNFDSGAITSDGSGDIYANTINNVNGEFDAIMTGDQFGGSAFRLQNRSGVNGVMFDTSAGTYPLCDMVFNTGSGTYNNIRFEQRSLYDAMAANEPNNGGQGEIQFINSNGGGLSGAFGAAGSIVMSYFAVQPGWYIGYNFTPTYTLDVQGTCGDSVDGTWNVDGSGNFTATTFNPVSDRTLKDQIKPLDPTNALAMVLSITNYSWRFKAHTNYLTAQKPTAFVTNWVTRFETNTITISKTNFTHIFTVTNAVVFGTNFVTVTNAAKVFPASGTEFGPMAQDWHAATGLQDGHKISATSEAGLLIGAVQGLASLQGTFTNAAGARFHLIVNPQTNGFIFVPQ